ncbi:MAG: DUF7507 domain-containing protein [Methanosarcina sp.]
MTGPTGDNFQSGVLNVGEVWVYEGNYTVTQQDVNSNGGGDGFIENTAAVDCDQLEPKYHSAQVPIIATPAYTIDKKVIDVAGKEPEANISKAGETINYQINITNAGNVELTNVTLTDTLMNLINPEGDNSPAGILNEGETWTYNGTYNVTQQDINTNGNGNGLIENIATVDCDQLEPKSHLAEVPVKASPAYIIDKTVLDVGGRGPAGFVMSAGDVLSYQINVSNVGNVDLTNVTVDEYLFEITGPAGDNEPAGILNTGETWIYTGNYTVTQEDINNHGTLIGNFDDINGADGDMDNIATVDCDQLDPKTHTAEVPLGTPVYIIDKTIVDVAGKGPAGEVTAAGDTISYQVRVTNSGNLDLTNITVSDSLVNLTEPTGDLEPLGILNTGEIWTYTGNYTVTQADTRNAVEGKGFINNTATLASTQLDPQNDTESVRIVLPRAYDIDKTVIDVAGQGPEGSIIATGNVIKYQVNVTNTGLVNLTNVSVIDTLINLTGPGESLNSNLILEIGEYWLYNSTYTVNQNDINTNGNGNGLIENTATVSCDQLSEKTDAAEVPIKRVSTYTFQKIVTDVGGKGPKGDVTRAGETISYSIIINNTGNTDLTNITIGDSLIALIGPIESKNENGILDFEESWTYTGSYTVTQADINSNGGGDGSIENTVTVNFGGAGQKTYTVDVPLRGAPAYTIEKTVIDVAGKGPEETVTKAGEIISYQIKVGNEGNTDLTNLTLNDSLTSLSDPVESKTPDRILEVGENWTYSTNYTATQQDLNTNGNGTGFIDNIATVDCDELEGKNNTAKVPLRGNPSYTVHKSITDIGGKGPSDTVTKAGEVISYLVEINNTGNVELTNTTAADSLINLTSPNESLSTNGVLEVGEKWTYITNYTVTQADLNNNAGGDGLIENTIKVSCDQLGEKTHTVQVTLKGLPVYTIEKIITDIAGDGPSGTITKAGETISYSVVVNNIGNIDLTNVTVSDPLASLTGPAESKAQDNILEVGEKWIYSANYTVKQKDLNSNGNETGLIKNTVIIDCDQLEGKSSSAEALLKPVPAYKIDKIVIDVAEKGPEGTISKAGETITYQIKVYNLGNVDLTNITTSDSLTSLINPVESVNPDGVLEVGENWTYNTSYTVTQTDVNTNGNGDGLIENKVTVDCDQLDPGSDIIEIPLKGKPAYTINKVVTNVGEQGQSGTITQVGQTIGYQVKIDNVGTVDLTNISVSDSLVNLTGPAESLNINNILEVGENWTYTGNYSVTQADINTNGGGNGLIENTATVSCSELDAKSDSSETPLKGIPAYIIDKTVIDVAGKGAYATVTKAGETINYQIKVSNVGNIDLIDVNVTDSLTSLTAPAESKTPDGILEVGENWTYNTTYSVTQTDINTNGGGNGLIENRAFVYYDQLEPKSNSAEVPVKGRPACTIHKDVIDVAGRGPFAHVEKAGETITYKVNVTNAGTVDLTEVNVTDSLVNLSAPAESKTVDNILEVDETWTYTTSYPATQADINTNGGGDGLIENTATVQCNQLEPHSDTTEVPLKGMPIYTIDKIITNVAGNGSSGTITKAGEIIGYQVNVRNSGNIDLTNVTVTDSLINLTGLIESKTTDSILEVDEIWTLTGNYTVTQADINSNGGGDSLIENIATVDCDQLEPKSDYTETPLQGVPAFIIHKIITDISGRGPKAHVENATDIIRYQINVTNEGNIDLTNVTVSDSLVNLASPTESKTQDNILEVNEIWTLTGNYTVTQADINNNGNGDGFLENTVSVVSDQAPEKSDAAEAHIKGNPGYTVEKTMIDVAGNGPEGHIKKAGEIITYQVNVTNEGNIDLTGITANDSLVNLTDPNESLAVNEILEVGEVWTYRGNYTVTQADINSNGDGDGLIENNVTVDCGQLAAKSDVAEVSLQGNPVYIIHKTITDVAQRGATGHIEKAGEIISYQVNVTNAGNIDLTNVNVTDSLTSLSEPFESANENGILDVDEVWTYTGNYTVTQADINTNGGGNGLIENTAIVSCNQLDAKSDSAEVPLKEMPIYTIHKDIVDVAGRGLTGNVEKAGEVIIYRVNVTNAGNVDLTNVTISDSLTRLSVPVESKNPDGILEVDEVWTYTGNYTVTQADINTNGNGTGFIRNTATVDCDQLESKSDKEQVFLRAVPAYIIRKDVISVGEKGSSGTVEKAGEIITYQVNVTNAGNIDLTNITISDSLTSLTGPVESKNPDDILAVDEIWTFAGNYTVTQTDINTNGNGNELIENTATVDCDQLEPKSDIAEVALKGLPIYTIHKNVIDVAGRGSTGSITKAGEIISYQVNVTNAGNIDLTNVNVTDSLASLAGPAESKAQDNILEVDEVWTYTGNYAVTQADLNSNGNGTGFIRNSATVDCDQLEPKSDGTETPLKGMPAYILDKTVTDVAGKGPVNIITKAKDIISYSVAVINAGFIDLTNVTVTDSLTNLTGPDESKSINGILNVDEIWNYTGNYTVTQEDINSNGNGTGFIKNTAIVDSSELELKVRTAEVPLQATPAYTIDKNIISIDGKEPSQAITRAGQTINYEIKVNNAGNVDLTNVTIADSLTNLTVPVESLTSDNILEVGENWTYAGNYTVTQTDLNSNGNGTGLIENTATVDCTQLEPKSDTVNIPLEIIPAYNIQKRVTDVAERGQAGIVTNAGEIISYSITVNNTGNIDLNNVTVSDSLTNLSGPVESKSTDSILEVGEIWSYTGNYTVTQTDLNTNGGGDGAIENTAKVSCAQLGEKSYTAEVSLNGIPVYIIDKRIIDIGGKGPSEIITKAGETITYQVKIDNVGNIDLTDVTVSDSLTDLIGPNESKTSDRILEVGENWTFVGNYSVSQADINTNAGGNGIIENTATVSCAQLREKTHSAEASLKSTPAYTLNKLVTDVAGKGPYGTIAQSGERISYVIIVNNAGNVDLTNVNVTDSLISLMEPVESINNNGILDVDENWTYSGTYTVTQADINSNGNEDGIIENTATVSCAELDKKTHSAEVPVKRDPAYMVEKTVTDIAGQRLAGSITRAGETISYSIILNNTGNTDLTNVTIIDSLTNLTDPIESKNKNGILEFEEGWIYESNYTVTQADLNSNGNGNSLIENTVRINCSELGEISDSAEVQLETAPAYNVEKIVTDVAEKGPAGIISKAGEVISYQIRINNDGNIDLTNLMVLDTLANLAEPVESIGKNGVLEVGENWTYSTNYTATQADINSNGEEDGFIENTVTIDCDQLDKKSYTASVPLKGNPVYIIDKTVTDVAGNGPAGVVTKAGEGIKYLITVKNAGSKDLTNVTVSDSLTNITGPDESKSSDRILEVEEVWNYTGTYTVTQADINSNGNGSGVIENTATVRCDQLEEKNYTAEVIINGAPAYTIDKTIISVGGNSSADTITKAGEVITYQIKVNNSGNIDLTNVTVADPLISLSEPSESEVPNGILEVGENWTYLGNYTVTQEDLNSNGNWDGIIENTATITCNELEAKSDSAEVPLEAAPVYILNKKVIDIAGKGPTGIVTKAGEGISYIVEISNAGNVELTNVTIDDFLINLSGPVESRNSNGVLEVEENWTYTGIYNVTQDDINSNGGGDGEIENLVKISCDQLGEKTHAAGVPLKGSPIYTIDKSVLDVAGKGPKGTVNSSGEIISYLIQINNTGTVDLTNVTVIDTLINLTGPEESINSNRVLEVGETWNYTGNYTVTQAEMNNNGNGDGVIENIAEVDCHQLEPKSDYVEVPLKNLPAYTIDKAVVDVAEKGPLEAIIRAGQLISYQIKVNNIGNIDLTNVTVIDSLTNLTDSIESKTIDKILEVGEIWIYNTNYTATQEDINSNGGGDGVIENKATVKSDQLGERSHIAWVPVKGAAVYILDKTVINVAGRGPDAYADKAGDIIQYQVNVSNAGNIDLTNVTISDSLINLSGPDESKLPDGVLKVNETWTYTGNYTVTQADINSNGNGTGLIENTVTVNSDQLKPEFHKARVPLQRFPAYVIHKNLLDVAGKGPDAHIENADDIIRYQIDVSNVGNVDLINVTVNDSLISLGEPSESKTTDKILEVGEIWVFTGNYTVTQEDMNNQNGNAFIVNNATVVSEELELKSDTSEVPFAGRPGYIIKKKAINVAGKGPDGVVTKAGDIIQYQVNVSNEGNINLTSINVSDPLISLSEPVETKNSDRILEVDETWTYTGNYIVTQADINSNGNGHGLIENTATVKSDQLGPKSDTSEVQLETIKSLIVHKNIIDVAGRGPTGYLEKAGDMIRYQVNVTNAGNVDLANLTASDSLIDLSDPIETKNPDRILEVNETWTYNGNYTANQTDINNNGNGEGFIENEVAITSPELNPQTDNANVPLKKIPIFLVDKKVIDIAGNGPSGHLEKAGDIVQYQINVSNEGNADLTNVTVLDSLVNLTGPLESKTFDNILEVGEIWTYTGNYSVTQIDINNNIDENGSLKNTVFVDCDQSEEKTHTVEIPLKGIPLYEIEKSVIDISGKGSQANVESAGDIIRYLIQISNAGNVDLTNVTVSDSLTNLTGPVESKTSDRILEVGETWNYTGNYSVSQADINDNGNGNGNNLIENTATVDCDQLGEKLHNVSVPLNRVAAYTISKTISDVAGRGPAGAVTKAGDVIRYSILISNAGNVDLTNVTVSDSLTTLTELNESKISNEILEAGENWTYNSSYTVTQADINSYGNGDGLIENTAVVDCNQLEERSSTTEVQIIGTPIYILDKSIIDAAGKGPSGTVTKAGEIIRYAITVSNFGNIDLINVTVSDALINLSGPVESKTTDSILEVGEIWSYTGNYTVTQADINTNAGGDGIIENTATVSCDQIYEKSHSAEVSLKTMPAYIIDKNVLDVAGKGPEGTATKAGEIITYEIRVTNEGNLDLTDINVNDSLATLTEPVESLYENKILDVGENWTYNATYSITQEDINSNGNGDGLIENNASVNCTQLGQKSHTVEVPVKRTPAYSIEKTVVDVARKGPTGNITEAEDTITYFITVYNTGNTELTNVTVFDSLANLSKPKESINENEILEVGENWSYNATYSISQEDLNNNGNRNGFIENTVIVDCEQLAPKSGEAKVPIIQDPVLI